MGKLKPVGSEKLDGMDKINRIMEIARYNEHIPQPINEDSSNEYKITLADGFNYQIVKEKNGYIIKKGLNESVDYLEPIKNRKYYSSYSAAFKRLNLITKEVNINEGQDKNISLFTESEESEKKYYLKLNANEQAAPAPAPVPSPTPETETPVPPSEPEAEMPPMDDMSDEGQDDEVVTFKTIQKLTGKLGQKLRTLNADEETKMSSDDIKYVINSVLSALDLNTLESEDKEEIMSKFEGGEEMGMEPEMGGEEMGMEPETEEEPIPQSPEGEMEEGNMGMSMEDISSMFGDEESGDLDYPSQPRHRKIKDRRISDDHAYKMEEMIEGIFSESKIDKILTKYFQIDEAEKREIQNKKPRVVSEEVERKKLVKRVQYVSESETQYLKSKKLIQQYPEAKLLGKTKNKNLVFQVNESKIKITPKGDVI